MTKVFVYGALRKGASHSWRMAQARFLGQAFVSGTLVKVDWYPGLVLEGTTRVKGEVYEVTDETLRALDEFEGIGIEDERSDEYERVSAMVSLENGETVECQIYQWRLGTESYEVVVNGDWLTVDVS